jgi:tetratricopeptide (TPR) repeat protein
MHRKRNPASIGSAQPWPAPQVPKPAHGRLSPAEQRLAAAQSHHRAGRLAEAEKLYRQVLTADPFHAASLHQLAQLASQIGRHEEAEELIKCAVAVAPAEPLYHLTQGNLLQATGQLKDAAASYRAAIALAPDMVDAHNNLGVTMQRQGRLEEAAACYRRAVVLGPRSMSALSNLGVVLEALGRQQEAIKTYHSIIALDPDHAMAHHRLGVLHLQLEQAAEAASCFETVTRLSPDLADEHTYLGMARLRLGRPDDAIPCFKTALGLQPNDAIAHFNLATTLLTLGEMPTGWREYEWRWRLEPGSPCRRDFVQPQWQGEPAAGRTILIHAEQGFGDALQFCRYAPLVKARGLRVVVEAPSPLIRLLSRLPRIDGVVETGAPLPAFDLQCPMLSLPLAFGTSLETIPGVTPYLAADARHIALWGARLDRTTGGGLRVGLVWEGGNYRTSAEAVAINRRRSLKPAQLAPLLEVPSARFFSLQKEGERAPAAFALIDYMDEMADFADTAALIANLDLVISVDTAVAHLAGALGKPVWLLDRLDHCWRWLAGRLDSPWYPTMRIYRQPSQGDWDSVLTQVVGDLRCLAGTTPLPR